MNIKIIITIGLLLWFLSGFLSCIIGYYFEYYKKGENITIKDIIFVIPLCSLLGFITLSVFLKEFDFFNKIVIKGKKL